MQNFSDLRVKVNKKNIYKRRPSYVWLSDKLKERKYLCGKRIFSSYVNNRKCLWDVIIYLKGGCWSLNFILMKNRETCRRLRSFPSSCTSSAMIWWWNVCTYFFCRAHNFCVGREPHVVERERDFIKKIRGRRTTSSETRLK